MPQRLAILLFYCTMQMGGIMPKDFTHFDTRGNAIMVDVSAKETSSRCALAKGSISMNSEAMNAVLGEKEKKGDVLGVARIAGIMAAKRCAELIPLCHPLGFDKCTVDFSVDEKEKKIEASCEVKLSGRTGAEMEALTGVSLALLAIYDMCKALDKAMVIGSIRLCEKSGGKSGRFVRKESESC
jgi:cyclic pyranopterin phosphate synthase